jgi:hypothetical protein
MKPEDDPEFVESAKDCILDLSPAELNVCEVIAKDLGVDPVVEAFKPFYARYLEEEGRCPERDEADGPG